MKLPLQITFRDMEHSDAIAARIQEKVEKLEQYHDRIMGCRVVVEAPHRHHHQGKIYNVRVDITVPGGEIVVNRDPGLDHSHEDIYVAIRDAFDEAKRQLQDLARRRRGKVKSHEMPDHGHITILHPEKDRGTIETPAGDVVHFHRNSVVNEEFDHLQVGQEVRFVIGEDRMEEGVWASSVYLIGKHHIVERT